MAHRPFTPRQQRQNAAFLAALRRSGNVRLTCRELGVNRSTWTKRRGKCPAFATEWDMALAAAHAAFRLAGGERMPEAGKGTGKAVIASPAKGREKQSSPLDRHDARASRDDEGLRTKGGEPTIVRLANGRLQRRLAPPGRMTDAAQRLVLATVGETNNLRMAARAAGIAHSTFLARCRLRPDLAGDLAIARRIGADRAMWQYMHPPGRPGPEEWQIADLPMPPMTVEQAILQLVYHRAGGPFHRSRWRRRTPPPPFEQVKPRIVAKLAAFRRAEWHRETGRWRYDEEE